MKEVFRINTRAECLLNYMGSISNVAVVCVLVFESIYINGIVNLREGTDLTTVL